MDFILSGIPQHFTNQSLNHQLGRWMKFLKISQAWHGEIPLGKNYALLTFLIPKEAEKFFQSHGEDYSFASPEDPKKHKRARLVLGGAEIYCRRSQQSPDPVSIWNLQQRTAKSSMAQTNPTPSARPEASIAFPLLLLGMGHYTYPSQNPDRFQLAYNADLDPGWYPGVAKFAKHKLILTMTSGDLPIRIEIDYRIIQDVVYSNNPTSLYPISLTVSLWEPPRFFACPGKSDIANMIKSFAISKSKKAQCPNIRKTNLPSYGRQETAFAMGQCLLYHITTSASGFEEKIVRMKQRGILTVAYHKLILERQSTISDSTNFHKEVQAFYRLVTNSAPILPFDLLFQFQGLVQNGFLLPQTMSSILNRVVDAAKAKKPLPISYTAVKRVFAEIPIPGPGISADTFNHDAIWDLLMDLERQTRLGLSENLRTERQRQNLVLVYKAQVTPTRILLCGPEFEAKNRILRKFPRNTDYFLRVQFCDEDGQSLRYSVKVNLDEVWQRFRTVLEKGIPIAGRHYTFLGFSHSSLRTHSAWFMAPFVDPNGGKFRTYFNVIKNLGKFSHLTSPARRAARIGQAFSETPVSVSLRDLGVKVEHIADVKSADGTRVFSDGVGTLSRDLMEAIHDHLQPKQRQKQPTCFQIRFGGAKGMIALDDTLSGMVLRIRPESMVKFPSKDTNDLEICDVSKPIPFRLNRQLIKILEDMGVDQWFLTLQSREVDRLRMITSDIDNTAIFLRRQKVADQIRFSQFIRRLPKIGVDYRQDPFLCSIVEAVCLRELRLLKHKARIPVFKGITLYGIMDEFGFLGEDEVYITFDKTKGVENVVVWDRDVILTRSPALHPGDIQLCRAVVPPEQHPLRSLLNCVVFSQKGTRDLPSQLSGGDLDGDIFGIIWDEEAVRQVSRCFPPADYPRVPPLDVGREVARKDMTDFFVQFMATDQLGHIAVKHTILADQESAGTVAQSCIKLAELHSTGVDYSKTGIPVDMNELRRIKGNVRYRPDFMALAPKTNLKDKEEIIFDLPVPEEDSIDEDDDPGPRFTYYKSNKILGQLYRNIDEHQIWRDDIRFSRDLYAPKSMWNDVLNYVKKQCDELGNVNWEAALERAQHIRHSYDEAIWSAASWFSEQSANPLSELEVFTGYIHNKSGAATARQREASINLKDEFDRISKFFESTIRKIRNRAPVETDGDDGDDDDDGNSERDGVQGGPTPLELSVACLHAGIERPKFETRANSRRGNQHFQSFKVLAASCVFIELDLDMRLRDMLKGSDMTGGGYVGVGSSR